MVKLHVVDNKQLNESVVCRVRMQTGPGRHEDDYLYADVQPTMTSAAAVTHRAPTTRYHRAATVDLHVRCALALLLVVHGLCNGRVSTPPVCPADRQQQRRAAGLLLSSGSCSR